MGGLYASGYTADEIQSTVGNLDFVGLLLDGSDRTFKSITSKVERNRYPINLSIDTKKFSVGLPTGVTDGENVYLELKKMFAKTENIHDFSKLPINFSAVATNLQTGNSVVMKEGDLALTTFKSMAIPTILEPVYDNNIYHVDGGVIDNLAIEEAIKQGADVVIAIDISAEETKVDKDSNIMTVLDKISSYRNKHNMDRQRGYADILITPDVRKHGTLDFSNINLLIDEGEKAANDVRSSLAKLSNEEAYNEIRKKAKALKDPDIDIKNISVNSDKEFVKEDIERLKPKKEKLNEDDLDRWAKKIYALDYIERVFYDVDGDNINFKVVENLKPKLQGGLSYVSDYGASLQLAGTIPSFGKTRRRSSVRMELSKYPKIAIQSSSFSNYWNNTFTNAFELSYGRTPLLFHKKEDLKSTYANETFSANYYTGTSIHDKLFVGYNLNYKNTRGVYLEGERLPNDLKHHLGVDDQTQFITNTAFMYIDTLDSKDYPHSGYVSLLSGFYGVSLEDTDKNFKGYSYNFGKYYTHKKLTVGGNVFAGEIKSDRYVPTTELFTLGGLRGKNKDYGFYGLPPMGIYTDKFVMGQVSAKYAIKGGFNAVAKANVATLDSTDTSPVNKKYKFGKDTVTGYGVGIGWDTFAGPMDIVVSNNALGGDKPLLQAHIGYTF